MRQGWCDDDYLMLFDGPGEADAATHRYGLGAWLPGYTIVGLKCWDDFLVRDERNSLFSVPTVPLNEKLLRRAEASLTTSSLQADPRYADRIRWFVQPLVFGGDAQSDRNIAWITIDQHAEAVKWWNRQYHELR